MSGSSLAEESLAGSDVIFGMLRKKKHLERQKGQLEREHAELLRGKAKLEEEGKKAQLEGQWMKNKAAELQDREKKLKLNFAELQQGMQQLALDKQKFEQEVGEHTKKCLSKSKQQNIPGNDSPGQVVDELKSGNMESNQREAAEIVGGSHLELDFEQEEGIVGSSYLELDFEQEEDQLFEAGSELFFGGMKRKLQEGERLINIKRAELEAGKVKLQQAQLQLKAAQEDLKKKQQQLDQAEKQLIGKEIALQQGLKNLAQGRRRLEKAKQYFAQHVGDHCELVQCESGLCLKDPCSSVQCQNGGQCIGGVCDCAEGFSGDVCQLAAPELLLAGCYGFGNYENNHQLVQAPLDVNFRAKNFTAAGWAKPTSRAYGMILSKDQAGVGSNQFRFEIHRSGQVTLGCKGVPNGHKYPGVSHDLNGWGYALNSPAALPLNEWTHLAIVRNGYNLILFVNGQQVKAVSGDMGDHNNGCHIRLGSRYGGAPPNGPGRDWFPGFLHNWHICLDKALTPEQIKILSGQRPRRPGFPDTCYIGPSKGAGHAFNTKVSPQAVPVGTLVPTDPCGPNCRRNRDYRAASDTFRLSVNGNQLSATRVDPNHGGGGWWMDLSVPCNKP